MQLSELKFIEDSSIYSEGYGAGEGTIDRTEYECPCGKGRVIYEKDNIPGFRESIILIYCDNCHEKYEPDYSIHGLKLKGK